jgi:hypothetical protein
MLYLLFLASSFTKGFNLKIFERKISNKGLKSTKDEFYNLIERSNKIDDIKNEDELENFEK